MKSKGFGWPLRFPEEDLVDSDWEVIEVPDAMITGAVLSNFCRADSLGDSCRPLLATPSYTTVATHTEPAATTGVYVENRLDKLYDDRLDGFIEPDFFERKAREWRQTQKRLADQIAEFEKRFSRVCA